MRITRYLFLSVVLSFLGLQSLQADCPNYSGKYALTTKIQKGSCDMKDKTEKFSAEVRQNGCNFTLDIHGLELKGKMKGKKVTITGSYDEGGEITKKINLTFSGKNFSGRGIFTYDMYGIYTCKGTEKIVGKRR